MIMEKRAILITMIVSREIVQFHKVIASHAKIVLPVEIMKGALWKVGARSLRKKRSLDKKKKKKKMKRRRTLMRKIL